MTPGKTTAQAPTPTPFSTITLPDGIVIGGPWPNTIITWPALGGAPRFRGATKPEYDLFQALEKTSADLAAAQAQVATLREALIKARLVIFQQVIFKGDEFETAIENIDSVMAQTPASVGDELAALRDDKALLDDLTGRPVFLETFSREAIVAIRAACPSKLVS